MMSTFASRSVIGLGLAVALGVQALVLGCGGGGGATGTTGASTSTSSTGATTAGAGGASSTTTGAGGQGGAATTSAGAGGQGGAATTTAGAGGQGGGAMGTLEALLAGDWKPVSMQQGQNPPEPAPSGSPYTIFHDTGEVWIGCGTPPLGTWTLSLDAPPPAIARIDVLFGGNKVSWYVVTLDPTTFVFAEGGDLFTYTRDACP